MTEVTSNSNYDGLFHPLSALATMLRRRTEHAAPLSLWEMGVQPGAARAPDSQACPETHNATECWSGVTNPSISQHLLYTHYLES